jgi:N terminus of Rad21 / Rec8 like protein
MFYSQIILAKKGPLGQVWQAAHWGARKLGRPAIFSTDIAAITTSIANPSVPMALRVSGHLLLGIVRIYSRQVQFLLDDCHQAMIKVKMAYSTAGTGSNNTNDTGVPMIDITLTTRGSGSNNATSNVNKVSGSGNTNALNISNFGEYIDNTTGTGAGAGKMNDVDDYYYSNTTTTHFAIPLEELLQRASDVSGMEHTDDDWVPAELDDSTLHISTNLLNVTGGMVDTTSVQQQSQLNKVDEDWGVFDPNDGEGGDILQDDDEEENNNTNKGKNNKHDDGSSTQYSDIEVTRAVNDSTVSDQVRTKMSFLLPLRVLCTGIQCICYPMYHFLSLMLLLLLLYVNTYPRSVELRFYDLIMNPVL